MAYKKIFRKKRKVFRKYKKRNKSAIPRSIGSPAQFKFKRSNHEIVHVGLAGNGWVLDGIPATTMGKTFDFRLTDLNDNADFTNLFRYYKITGVACKIWSSNTNTQDTNAYAATFPNTQLLLRWDQNQDGLVTGNSNAQNYMDSQTSKMHTIVRASARPIKLFMKVKQANMVYQQLSGVPPTQTAYTLKTPGWVDTSVGTGCSHYGLNMMIQRLDDSGLTSGMNNQQTLRFEYTYYVSCKKVQ